MIKDLSYKAWKRYNCSMSDCKRCRFAKLCEQYAVRNNAEQLIKHGK